MIVKRKLYSQVEERVFGEVKRANKAAKRAELLKDPIPRETIDSIKNDLSSDLKRKNSSIDLTNKLRELTKKGKKKSKIQLSPEELSEAARVKAARHNQRGSIDSLKMITADNKSKINYDVLARNSNPENRRLELDHYKRGKRLKEILDIPSPSSTKSSAESVIDEGKSKVVEGLSKSEAKQLRADRLSKVEKLKAIKARKVRNAKIGAGIVAGTAVLGTGAYLAKKHNDKKKNRKD